MVWMHLVNGTGNSLSLLASCQPPPPPHLSFSLFLVLTGFGIENKDALMPYCGGHYRRFASFAVLSVCFSINSSQSHFAPPPPWMHPVSGTGNSPSPGRPTPGVVKQDKSSGGSVDTTKTRSDPQRVRMCSGERPIGAAKGKQTNTTALCQPPPPPPLLSKATVPRAQDLERYMFYYTRYYEHVKSKEFNESDLRKAQDKAEAIQKACGGWNAEYIVKAVEQLIENRTMLQYTYIYAFYLTGADKGKDLFEYNQAKLEAYTEVCCAAGGGRVATSVRRGSGTQGANPGAPAAQRRYSSAPGGSRARWATAGARAEQGTWGSRTRKPREARCGRPEDGGVGAAKTVKQPRQQPAQPPIRQLLGAADTQTTHPATTSTAPVHQLLGSVNAETTPAGAPAAAADRTQRPDATCEGKTG